MAGNRRLELLSTACLYKDDQLFGGNAGLFGKGLFPSTRRAAIGNRLVIDLVLHPMRDFGR